MTLTEIAAQRRQNAQGGQQAKNQDALNSIQRRVATELRRTTDPCQRQRLIQIGADATAELS